MKNAGKERAILYREFCEWCYTVPHLELDPRLHTHSGRIEDGGYISHRVTAAAFAAWQAARRAPAAPQPQADARDTERLDALYKALEVCSAELFAQCSHQGRAMKYAEQARKALAAEQCARAAIAAAKEMK